MQNLENQSHQAPSKTTQPGSTNSKQETARLINELFQQLKTAKPVLPPGTDMDEMKRQYLLAFMENGINDWNMVQRGLKAARSPDNPEAYFPVPSRFIAWCRPPEHWEHERIRIATEEFNKAKALPKLRNPDVGKKAIENLKTNLGIKNAR